MIDAINGVIESLVKKIDKADHPEEARMMAETVLTLARARLELAEYDRISQLAPAD